VIVGDNGYAVLALLAATRTIATVVTRLRLDARLFAPAPPRLPHHKGRPRVKGDRLPTLAERIDDPTTVWTDVQVPCWYGVRDRLIAVASGTAVWHHPGQPVVPVRWVLIRDPHGSFPTQALLCTDLAAAPHQIVSWFVLRWQMETTFHEVRAHLGVETGRGWSEKTIRRTTPTLLGLFSFVTLLAHEHWTPGTPLVKDAAWYRKREPTFIDALAVVRRSLWSQAEMQHVPRAFLEHRCTVLCYAA
jgi:hypothetical protein